MTCNLKHVKEILISSLVDDFNIFFIFYTFENCFSKEHTELFIEVGGKFKEKKNHEFFNILNFPQVFRLYIKILLTFTHFL